MDIVKPDFFNGKTINSQHMKLMDNFSKQGLHWKNKIKIAPGVERAGDCWFSGKSTGLRIGNRGRLGLLGPYCNKTGGSRGGRGRRGWLSGKIKEKPIEGSPDGGSQKNQCGKNCKRRCIFPSSKNPSSWSVLEADSEYKLGKLTSKRRFWLLFLSHVIWD